MGRDKDRFNIIYVGDCEKTDDKAFFVQHSRFKCWTKEAGSDKNLHVAILPLFESTPDYRKNVLSKIMTRYKPPCNSQDVVESKPDYKVRKSENLPSQENPKCQCCGSEMKVEQILEKSTLYRCIVCNISDTRLNS